MRPRPNEARACRSIDCDRGATSRCRQMGRRSIGPNIEWRPLDQTCEFAPIRANSLHGRPHRLPDLVQIRALDGIRSLCGQNCQPAIIQPARKLAPSRLRPALVRVEGTCVHHCIRLCRRKNSPVVAARTDNFGLAGKSDRLRESHQLRDAMAVRFDHQTGMNDAPLPPLAPIRRAAAAAPLSDWQQTSSGLYRALLRPAISPAGR